MTQRIKITTRGRYTVMAMVELAKGEDGKPIPLSGIAARGDISLSYLEQLVAGLRRCGLVKSYRGPGGGYILARPLSDILIADILTAAEDSAPAKRKKKNSKAETNNCDHTHALWEHIGEMLYASLNKISLEDVLQGRLSASSLSCKNG